MNELINGNAIKMTSIEIAELVGSRPDNVKISIERLAKSGVIQLPALQVFEIINGLGHRAILHFASQRNVALSVLRCEGCSQLFPQWGISSTDGLTVRASTR